MRPVPILAIVALTVSLGACSPPENARPMCHPAPPAALMAESVASAAFVPCVRSLPDGWDFQGFAADEGEATFSLSREAGGLAEITLHARCDTTGEDAVASTRPGVREFRDATPDGRRITWTSVFSGGCVTLDVWLAAADRSDVAGPIHEAISLLPRSSVRPS